MLCSRFRSVFILLLFFVCSCSEDEGYIPVEIITIPDDAEVFQDDYVIIAPFKNDVDLPKNAVVSISNPDHGLVQFEDPNHTPNNLLDDVIRYQSDQSFAGIVVVTYTICDQDNPNNCSSADIRILVKARSFVNDDLDNMPFEKLSDYNFFQGTISELTPSYRVISYSLNSSLFSDYAQKKRFVWMPKHTQAVIDADDTVLNFPIGTILIKNFYYENVAPDNSQKLIETRLMYLTEEGWDFAEYVWNDNQTDAFFDDGGSFKTIDWTENGELKSVNYRIPSRTECFSCHNTYGTPLPIGPKPQNLNKIIAVGQGTINQLDYLVSESILQEASTSQIESTVDWQDESQSLELRVRSYLDINCAHCHSNESYCDYRPIRLAFNKNSEPEHIGICVDPDVPISPFEEIITPGEPDKSLLLFRLKSTEEQYRMPLLGRSLQHQEGIDLIEAWINSLDQNCE